MDDFKSEEAENWYWDGNDHYSSSRFEEAIVCYQYSLNIEQNSGAMDAMGSTLYKLKKYEESIEWFNKIINIDSSNKENPDIVDSISNERKGKALDKLGRHEEAIEAYEESIRIKPDYNDAFYFKGLVLDKLGRHEEAIEAYKKNLEVCDIDIGITQDLFDSWKKKGNTLDKLGRHEEAIEAYEEFIYFCNVSLDENPNDIIFLIQKTKALFELNKFEDVIESCNKILRIKSNHLGALILISESLDKLGRHEESSQYNQLIEKNNVEDYDDENWEEEYEKHQKTTVNARVKVLERNIVKESRISTLSSDQMKYVESSNLKKIGYDFNLKIMYVEFLGSGMYAYYDVPEKKYNELLSATSKGSYLNNHIKNKFKFKKINFYGEDDEPSIIWAFD
jgi:tetratricopeptide (TPR) repeat protein